MKKRKIHVYTLTICFCIMQFTLTPNPLTDPIAFAATTTSSHYNQLISPKTASTQKTGTFNVKTLASSGKDDKNSFVLAILGDGFTQNEQDDFNTEAQKMSDYILKTKPFSDAKDKTNIYAVDVISNQSGAAEDPSSPIDTYFGSSYNTNGIQRLLYYTKGDPQAVAKQNVPDYDFAILLVNSKGYGGAGGSVAVSSLDETAPDTVLHEMGHTIGGLVDEYFYQGEEGPNMTRESDPAKVKWKQYIGQDGVGVVPYEEPEAAGWYKPSKQCKMHALDEDFCPVCCATLTKKINQYAKEVASDGNYYDYGQNTGTSNGDYDYSNSDYDSNSISSHSISDNANSNYDTPDDSDSNYDISDHSDSNCDAYGEADSFYDTCDEADSCYGKSNEADSNYCKSDETDSNYCKSDDSDSGHNYCQNKKNHSSKNPFKKVVQWFSNLL
jgi:hypothetical protein